MKRRLDRRSIDDRAHRRRCARRLHGRARRRRVAAVRADEPEVFRPTRARSARAFSDPPMNLVEGRRAVAEGIAPPSGQGAAGRACRPGRRRRRADADLGIRASALRVRPRTATCGSPAASTGDLWVRTPLSTSRRRSAAGRAAAGRHGFTLGAPITLCLAPAQTYVFDARGELVVAPDEHTAGAVDRHGPDHARPRPPTGAQPAARRTGRSCCR